MDLRPSSVRFPGPLPVTGQRSVSLRAALLRLVLASLVPLVLVTAGFLWLQWSMHRTAAVEELRERVQMLALAVERELGMNLAILDTLAALPEIDRRDWAGFHRVAAAAMSPHALGWIVLVEPSGQMVVNTQAPVGAPLPNLLETSAKQQEIEWEGRHLPSFDTRILEPLASGRANVTSLFYGPVIGRPVLSASVPVLRNGEPRYSLNMGFTPDALAALLASQRGSGTADAAVVDANGRIIARNADQARYLGARAPAPFDQVVALGREGVGEGSNLEGVPVVYAYRRVAPADWVTVIAIPREEILSPVLRMFVPWLIATVLLLGAATYLAHRLQRRMALPLAALAASAEALQRGTAPDIPDTRIQELDTLSLALRQAAQREREVREELERGVRERTASLEEKSRRLEQTAAALRAKEGQMEALLENTPAIIFMKDLDGRYLLVNRYFERVFNLRGEGIVGKTCAELFPPDVAERLCEDDRRVLETGAPMEVEEVVQQEGEPRTYLAMKFPVRDADGHILALCGIATDVTERRRTGLELMRTLTVLQAILDSASYAIISTDTQGTILTVNHAAERMLGYSAAELVGRATPQIFHDPEEMAQRAAALSREQGEPVNAGFEVFTVKPRRGQLDEEEWTYVRKDGVRVPVRISITALRGVQGAITGYLGIASDITERKRAEQAMLEQERRFRAIFDQTFQFTGLLTPDGTVLEANQTALDYVGAERIDVVGRPFWDTLWWRISQEVRDRLRLAIAEAAQGRFVRYEIDALGANNTIRTLDFSLKPVYDEHGEVVLLIPEGRDITERKQAEAAIEHLNRALERRAAELEAVNRELESFSYSVSHDLRTPLRSIDGFSQVLLEDYSDRLDEEGRDSLRRVRAASQRMAQLIDDILKLSRLSRAELRHEPVDLSAMARAVADELREADPQRQVEFVIADGVTATADPRLMRVVLENLLGNAWKYTSHHPRAQIEFGVERHADGTTVYFVSDDGAGFDMGYAGKLFGAFQRLHTAAEFPGTGVGLSSVQRIIHRHGGEVWAEGAVEVGATFRFTLPDDAAIE
ncbi:MAG TPA: PAS domain S-box protein [Aromatoleum sp.]|uniref:PAS domain S-box protein n=1 Tax=Aromatoleum sp. TaxID=2307007 RepID=UPI002B47EEE7|nr:PAS domain S-box protein [Aromatoleum sp.]HJV27824.1 PAS domain S-box protein [Aromatoleum sp.]